MECTERKEIMNAAVKNKWAHVYMHDTIVLNFNLNDKDSILPAQQGTENHTSLGLLTISTSPSFLYLIGAPPL